MKYLRKTYDILENVIVMQFIVNVVMELQVATISIDGVCKKSKK